MQLRSPEQAVRPRSAPTVGPPGVGMAEPGVCFWMSGEAAGHPPWSVERGPRSNALRRGNIWLIHGDR